MPECTSPRSLVDSCAPCDDPVMRGTLLLLLLPLIAGPGPEPPAKPPFRSTAASTPTYTVTSLTLPGAGEDGIGMDVMAYDPHTGFVWAPAGNTGAVDVVDTSTGKVTQVTGFPTREVEA